MFILVGPKTSLQINFIKSNFIKTNLKGFTECSIWICDAQFWHKLQTA